MKSSRRKGTSFLSKSVKVRYGGMVGSPVITETHRLSDAHKRRAEALKARRAHIDAMSFQDRQAMMDIDPEFNDDGDGPPDPLFCSLPPGEEAMFMSHAGGEEQLCRDIFETVNGDRKRKDTRTRRDRTLLRNKEWEGQLADLVQAYMDWKAGRNCHASDSDVPGWDMFVVHFFDNSVVRFYPLSSTAHINETLVRHGYLGTAPRSPTVALSFQVLEAYRQLHRVCPRLGVQGMARALCHLHSDESSLKFSFLVTMDGNSSLKLVDDVFRGGIARTDDRTGRTDIWISPEEVNRFKDEVKHHRQQQQPASPSGQALNPSIDNNDDDSWLDVDIGDDPSEPTTICVERWRNAGPEARKKMFALFAVTGVGELMKYPLAIIDKLIDVYGSNVKIGYDIYCAFAKTLASSFLNERVTSVGISGVVPAFHGHSHNRGCQLYWHPLYMDGVGKEDFEGCERLFSESNALASGKFIFNNYQQALGIIKEGTRALRTFSQELKTNEADYERYLEQERAYLRSLQSEPPEVELTVEYLKALRRYQLATQKSAAAKVDYERLSVSTAGLDEKAIKKIKTLYRTTLQRQQNTEEEIFVLEDELAEVRRRDYRIALDNLERLIVQRLFELTKLGMSGVGYKMREKIGKALKARTEAIRKALAEYNMRAAALSPPRPQLSWNEVMEMVSLAEFDILRDARQDIRSLPWAQRPNREAMNTYFNVKRAREELTRLNIEINRLFTSMIDEHVDYYRAISACCVTDPSLASELSVRWQLRDCIHEKIADILYRTSCLRGFSGRIHHGRRVGRDVSLIAEVPLPRWAMHTGANVSRDVDDDQDEDGGIPGTTNEEDAHNLVQFFDNLGISAPAM
ncbi:hypothetical protein A0H81_12134 [Grifola frondosa]|uniref:CxC1-like cysteine cluster associated with KDZ transposases domain-containing protein n=1 Tax=Grifola frondosa TaxID=5627 RepID=A0A1C7LT97_GRIFR|nr:hypothetical protein A0H81_12134 [Grifola frondosa]